MRLTEGNLYPWPVAGEGYERITSLGSATGLTVPKDVKGREPRVAILVAETQDIRWRDDGTNPTSSVGMLLSVGNAFLYTGDLHKIKFIESASGGKLNVSYYR